MFGKIRLSAACLVTGFLAACSTTTSPPADAAAGPAPTNYRATAISQAKQSFIDPYSVRDATISQPLYASAIFDGVTPFPRKGWIVCIRANAKNRMGGYTGQQYTLLAFRGEVVDLTLSGPEFTGQLESHCAAGSYSPLPEIEGRG